eukprot:TRINITY_DN2688_c0_g1_i4.p1 TRINITY_DN2688_c0_g1~~TRINITY_DN2688_c0_g1_i4.p1  ORF type:complete len:164 (+),score=18.44 TRINITY_DN2688_c0_g1_i4:151-642(+)
MATPTPPAAPRRPFVHEDPFGGGRSDPFHWLKDREDPAVIEYLEAENEYTEAVLQSEQHEKALYEEFLTRIQETDETPPYRKGDYMYYTRTVTGLQYTIYCRRRRLPGACPSIPAQPLYTIYYALYILYIYILYKYIIVCSHVLLLHLHGAVLICLAHDMSST